MELSFDSLEIREICEDSATAIEQLGTAIAGQLKARLADIESVETVAELMNLLPEFVSANHEHVFVRLSTDTVLALKPGNITGPLGAADHVNWSDVDRVLVTGIGADDD